MFGKSKPMFPPSDAQASEKLAHFVYEYLVFSGAEKAAQTFLQEIGWERHILSNEAPGFLFSWWSVFWDLYCAAPERRDDFKYSNEARAFYEFPPVISCGPPRGVGPLPNGAPPQGWIRAGSQQNNSNSYQNGGPISQQQRGAVLMHQQQAMASRPPIYGNQSSRLMGGQPHEDTKMGIPMMIMPGGIPEGFPFSPIEPRQQQSTCLPGGVNVSSTSNGGNSNIFFRSIPSLPIASTPSVTLRHQPTASSFPRQSPNSLSRQLPHNQQQSINGGTQPSLNSSSSASSFSGSPNNVQMMGAPEHLLTSQPYESMLQQQLYQQQQQQQQTGPPGKFPPKNMGQINGMIPQPWCSGPPQQQQQQQQYPGKTHHQPANLKSNKFLQSQEQLQQQDNLPLLFEAGDISNLASGLPGNDEIFDFYDGSDRGGYMISCSGENAISKQTSGFLVSSSAMQSDLENRLPHLSEASSSSASLLADDRPSQMKSQICQLLSPSPAAFNCGRASMAGVSQQGGVKPSSPLTQSTPTQSGGMDPTGEDQSCGGLLGLSGSDLEMLEAVASAGDGPMNPSMQWTTTSNIQTQPPSLSTQGNSGIYQNNDAKVVKNLVDSMQEGDQQLCLENASLFLQE